MGTLFSSLDIGRAGLNTAQIQLDVVGHNIASASKPGFSRQRAMVSTRFPLERSYGFLGRGPYIAGVERLRDPFLDITYRDQVATRENASLQAQFFSRVEDLFREPSEEGFSAQINAFFNALNDFANNVEDIPTRVATITQAESLASTFREFARNLEDLRTAANEDVRALVPAINSTAQQIADLNFAIRTLETGGSQANDLRDDRDVLLDQLAGYIAIDYREREDGQVDVLINGEQLVVGRSFRALETFPSGTFDPNRPDFLQVRFANTGSLVTVTDGELAGAFRQRDVVLQGLVERNDRLAAGFIEGINAIHSRGNGLSNLAAPIESTNPVTDPALPLNAAGLPFPVQDGAFDLLLYDNTGALAETVTVPITAGATSLNDVAAAINGSANATATITDGILEITPNAGFTFTFANDSSNYLAATGTNGLFTGNSARNMRVSQHLVDNPALLSSGDSPNLLETGDNDIALEMAALRNRQFLSGGTESLNDFYESTVVQLGIEARANLDRRQTQISVINDLNLRRQEVSGVNLDEEVTTLIQVQKAFDASARVITVTDRMLDTLLGVVR